MEKTKYDIIIEYIKDQAEQGLLKPGDKIPSENEIALMFNFSRHTIRKAISELQIQRFIYTEQGRGTFIADPNLISIEKPVNAPKVIGLIVAYINDINTIWYR